MQARRNCSVFLVLARRTQKLRTVIVFCCCFGLMPVGWAFRNYLSTGHFIVSSVTAFSVLQFKAAGALASERAGKTQSNFEAAQKELESKLCADLTAGTTRPCTEQPPTSIQPLNHLARITIFAHLVGAI